MFNKRKVVKQVALKLIERVKFKWKNLKKKLSSSKRWIDQKILKIKNGEKPVNKNISVIQKLV